MTSLSFRSGDRIWLPALLQILFELINIELIRFSSILFINNFYFILEYHMDLQYYFSSRYTESDSAAHILIYTSILFQIIFPYGLLQNI